MSRTIQYSTLTVVYSTLYSGHTGQMPTSKKVLLSTIEHNRAPWSTGRRGSVPCAGSVRGGEAYTCTHADQAQGSMATAK